MPAFQRFKKVMIIPKAAADVSRQREGANGKAENLHFGPQLLLPSHHPSLQAACGHQADHCIYCTPVTLVRYHQASRAGEGKLETSTHLDAEKMPQSEGELVAPKHKTKNAAEEANVSGEILSPSFYCDGIEMSHSK